MAKKRLSQADNSQDLPHVPLSLSTLLKHLYAKLAPEGSQRRAVTYQFVRWFVNGFRISERNYRAWIKQYDQIGDKDLQIILEQLDQMTVKPLISILMPIYNPDLDHLDAAIQSVREQVYPHWELCLADDASTIPGVRECIEKHINENTRIRGVFREENGHISAASNSALALAKGEYIALLDHDDALHPLALFYVVQAINQHPECEVIYSDEDKLTQSGKRIEPYYKSDFDPDLLLSQNMVSHLGVYKTARVREVGGFREGLEGSQDYDLLLRVIEKIEPHQVWHIPRVLYHWRITRQSVATSVDVKPYALEAGLRALQDHLADLGIQAKVETVRNFGYRVNYAMADPFPSVHLFVCAQTLTDTLVEGLRTLMASTAYQPLKISLCVKEKPYPQKSLNELKKLTDPRFRLDLGVGDLSSGLATNQYVGKTDAEIIGFVDESINYFTASWLVELVSYVNQAGIGAVGPKLLYKNGAIYSCGLVLGVQGLVRRQFNGMANEESNAYFGWASLVKGYSAIPGECVLMKRRSFVDVGGFSTTLAEPAAQMLDMCLKIKELGLRNVVVPDVEVTLDLSNGSKDDLGGEVLIQNESDRTYLMRHWGDWIAHDPAFSPNLNLHKGKPIVKPPLREK